MTPPELREKAARLATLCDQVGTELKSAERHFYALAMRQAKDGLRDAAWQQARRQAAMTPDAIRARIRRLEAIASTSRSSAPAWAATWRSRTRTGSSWARRRLR